MTKPALNLDAALSNIMEAIYARTASTSAPLTADNCRASFGSAT